MNKKIRKSSPYVIALISLIAIAWAIVFFMQGAPERHKYTSPFLNIDATGIDSLIEVMPMDQKIGQLIFCKIDKYSYQQQLDVFSKDNRSKPGAIFLETDSLSRYLQIVKQLQQHSRIKYLIGCATPSGIPRLNDLPKFANTSILQWINNDSLVLDYADFIVKMNEILSINISLLVQNEYLSNEMVVYDSLNIEKVLKTSKLLAYKLQEKNILSGLHNYNYFPENDTTEDFLKHAYPYKILGNLGISAIVAKCCDSINQISRKKFFSENYNFNGLIISELDSLNYMKEKMGELFLSGADVILTDYDYLKISSDLNELVGKGVISKKLIDEKLRKVLLAKEWTANKNYEKPVDTLLAEVDFVRGKLFDRKVKEKAITILTDKNQLIPLKGIHKRNICIFNIGNTKLHSFEKNTDVYKSAGLYHFSEISSSFINEFKQKCKSNNTVILAISDYNVDTSEAREIKWLFDKYSKENDLILVNFEEENNLTTLEFFETIIQVFDNSPYSQHACAGVLFGGIGANGKLAFNINDSLKFNHGLETNKTRLKYTIPEEVGISSTDLEKVHLIANEAIRKGATPGCQIFVAKDGKVILNESYGYHTYSKARKVKNSDLYDVASITKIVATTLQAMKMIDNRSIGLNNSLSRFFRDKSIDYSNIEPDTIFSLDTFYFDEVSLNSMKGILKERDTLNLNDSMFIAFDTLLITTTPKNNIFKISIRELLLHKSGLQPSMPILRFMLYKNDTVNNFDEYYARSYNRDSASRKIANGVYLRNSYFDTLWKDTKRMKVYSRKRYNYSDANMIILQMALDSLNRRSISSYMQSYFYTPLGLKTTCYRPLYRFNKYRIVPTERDKYWRTQELRGYVHDPTAALLGGIAGNAGVFSNAHDLGIIMQMLLNNGTYGGRQFLNPSTVKLFTSKQKDHHRGLGFDMKHRKSIMAKSASSRTYGHTGFTGSCVWVDPDEKLVFVFLSNRVHPSVKNWRLNSYKIRNRIHEAIYEAIKNGKEKKEQKESKPLA